MKGDELEVIVLFSVKHAGSGFVIRVSRMSWPSVNTV